MNILLVCFSGMSTGIMSIRMKEAAKKSGLEINVKAVPVSEAENHLEFADAVLIGPQLKYALSDITQTIADAGKKIPVVCISPKDYGIMNGEKVLKDLLEFISH